LCISPQATRDHIRAQRRAAKALRRILVDIPIADIATTPSDPFSKINLIFL
jgi:hypothetical protein